MKEDNLFSIVFNQFSMYGEILMSVDTEKFNQSSGLRVKKIGVEQW